MQLEPKEAAHNLLRLHRVDNQEWHRISIHFKYISTIDVFYLLKYETVGDEDDKKYESDIYVYY